MLAFLHRVFVRPTAPPTPHINDLDVDPVLMLDGARREAAEKARKLSEAQARGRALGDAIYDYLNGRVDTLAGRRVTFRYNITHTEFVLTYSDATTTVANAHKRKAHIFITQSAEFACLSYRNRIEMEIPIEADTNLERLARTLLSAAMLKIVHD